MTSETSPGQRPSTKPRAGGMAAHGAAGRGSARPLPALRAADAAVLDLADHVRPLLGAATVPVWCDLHDYDGANPYRHDFLAAATHVFLNDDGIRDRAALRAFLTGRVVAGAETAVATLGADGAMAATADGVHHVPAVPVSRIVDTNGAGDAFFAGFLMAHLGGADVASALSAGAHQAARCIASPNLAP
ncbi:PfkB family carbohydrate kinase [Actinokineospora sp. 24-640]